MQKKLQTNRRRRAACLITAVGLSLLTTACGTKSTPSAAVPQQQAAQQNAASVPATAPPSVQAGQQQEQKVNQNYAAYMKQHHSGQ